MMLAMNENTFDIWCESDKRKIWPRLENCKVHNFTASMQKYDELEFKRTLHPHHSYVITSADCGLFRYVKEKLKGYKFRSIINLENERVSILEDILQDKKIEVFETYLRNYKCIVENNNVYYKVD